MNRSLTKSVFVALVMLGASLAAWYMTPPDRSNEPVRVSLETMVPESFGDWTVDRSVVPISLSADVESALYAVYDAVLGRTYIDSKGNRIMLSLGYSKQQGGVQKPHWQEICYRAQGFTVSNLVRQPAVIAGRSMPVTRMLATQRGRNEPVTYWLTLGDHVVKDRWDRLLKLLSMSFDRRSADGYLVRISSISSDSSLAYQQHMQFAESLISALPPAQLTKFVGGE